MTSEQKMVLVWGLVGLALLMFIVFCDVEGYRAREIVSLGIVRISAGSDNVSRDGFLGLVIPVALLLAAAYVGAAKKPDDPG